MSNSWIYIGADIDKKTWSKIGKTTIGLETRHTSSQNTGYCIYTAYNIISGNVNKIELELLRYLEYQKFYERLTHISTGGKSECFAVNPYEMQCVVESFIKTYYPLSVNYDHASGEIRRVQCLDVIYGIFKPQVNPVFDLSSDTWFGSSVVPLPQSLEMSKDKYFIGNQVKTEEDLGEGEFFDFELGMYGYRDEDGYIYWHQYK